MPLTDAERQQRYRERKEAQGAKRLQVMVSQSVAEQVREICQHQKLTQAELFTRLIDEEYQRMTDK